MRGIEFSERQRDLAGDRGKRRILRPAGARDIGNIAGLRICAALAQKSEQRQRLPCIAGVRAGEVDDHLYRGIDAAGFAQHEGQRQRRIAMIRPMPQQGAKSLLGFCVAATHTQRVRAPIQQLDNLWKMLHRHVGDFDRHGCEAGAGETDDDARPDVGSKQRMIAGDQARKPLPG